MDVQVTQDCGSVLLLDALLNATHDQKGVLCLFYGQKHSSYSLSFNPISEINSGHAEADAPPALGYP